MDQLAACNIVAKNGRWEPVAPGLDRWLSGLSGPHQPVNSYAVRRNGKITLIDPAADLTQDAVGRLGGHPVADILITHFQEENVAGCVHFPEALLHVPAGDEYLADGPEAYWEMITPWHPPWDWTARGNFPGHVAGACNERPATRALRIHAPLIPGEAAVGFQVLSTPGHGKNAVTLVTEVAGKRIGFCGDLVFGDGRLWNWFDSEWDYGLHEGQFALLASATRLGRENLDVLCPSHGNVIEAPAHSLEVLRRRLSAVLQPFPAESAPINFIDVDSPAPGFREILPGLHQHRDGNCAILVSRSGQALAVDAGFCYWKPMAEREAHHRAVISATKRALGIERIEVVVPTHYHGDHTENIPALMEEEGAEVVCLERTAGPIERPGDFNLCCPLPWYGTTHKSFRIARKLPDGTRFPWREFELEIFHLGGQTDYALGVQVILNRLCVLFVGDATDNRNAICEPVLCYNKADPETAGWPYALARMIERRPDLLVCGHGSAIRSPMPFLMKKRDAWKRHLEDFRALSGRVDLCEFFDPFFGVHRDF